MAAIGRPMAVAQAGVRRRLAACGQKCRWARERARGAPWPVRRSGRGPGGPPDGAMGQAAFSFQPKKQMSKRDGSRGWALPDISCGAFGGGGVARGLDYGDFLLIIKNRGRAGEFPGLSPRRGGGRGAAGGDSMSAKSLAKYPQVSILRDILQPRDAAGTGASAPGRRRGPGMETDA
jgi:hypothetical protein